MQTFRRRSPRLAVLWILISGIVLTALMLPRVRIGEATCLNLSTNDTFVVPDVPDLSKHLHAWTETCQPANPCHYDDSVDLRIIVMTFDRYKSLYKCLEWIERLDRDGDRIAIEIWIDRYENGSIHESTFAVAMHFQNRLENARVHVHNAHVGIIGQWVDTWRPKRDGKELALLLEDDVDISPHAWKWIKAVHRRYGNRSDCHGYTLRTQDILWGDYHSNGMVTGPKEDTVFLYQWMGSWGFIPHPEHWRDFQDWFRSIYGKFKDFKPYLDKKYRFQDWYEMFERQDSAHNMWTMWFLYYTTYRKTYCIYSNLNTYKGSSNYSIAVNRRENGLHFSCQFLENSHNILKSWSESHVKFPEKIARYDFDGNMNRVL